MAGGVSRSAELHLTVMLLGSTAGETTRRSPGVLTAGSHTSETAMPVVDGDVGQRPFVDVEHRVAGAVARQPKTGWACATTWPASAIARR